MTTQCNRASTTTVSGTVHNAVQNVVCTDKPVLFMVLHSHCENFLGRYECCHLSLPVEMVECLQIELTRHD